MWALLLLLAAGEKLEGPVIGIDLGESTSCAGTLDHCNTMKIH